MAVSEHTITLPENRTDLETLIEAAIARLDEIDGDVDLEDGADDEPSLGATNAHAGHWRGSNLHILNRPWDGTDDREDDCEDEGAASEDEGAPNEDHDAAEDDYPIYITGGAEHDMRGPVQINGGGMSQ